MKSPLVNLLLFLATVATTTLAGGPQFSAALIAILFSHEMGHYVMARWHKVDTTLPFFIPIPAGFGTLGAVIRMRSALPSRDAVMDIGAAGPIAGFLVATPLLFVGFALSTVVQDVPVSPNGWFQSPAALLYAWWSGHPLTMADRTMMEMGDGALSWAAAHLTHDLPAGADLQLHPIAMAAWFGLLMTALNMIPIGQLDGGHVIYALFGRNAEKVSRAMAWGLLGLGLFVSWNWLIWWLLVRLVVGVGHPPAVLPTPLSRSRVAIGVFSLVIFALTFIPVPIHM